MNSTNPLAQPPEGAISGEDVPRENEKDEHRRTLITQTMAILKANGEPFTTMQRDELRERAIKTLRRNGVNI